MNSIIVQNDIIGNIYAAFLYEVNKWRIKKVDNTIYLGSLQFQFFKLHYHIPYQEFLLKYNTLK